MHDMTVHDADQTHKPQLKWDGRGGYITTFSGKQFMLAEPTIDMVNIKDIAHALSMICHFGGHTRQFFSVAQHSVLVSHAAQKFGHDKEFRRWALMHDAAEAYLGDVTRPLKSLLPEYKVLEKRVMRVIANAFDMTWPEPEGLKRIDDSILKWEAQHWMPNAILHDGHGVPYDLPDPPELPIAFTVQMNPPSACVLFLREFLILFNDDDGL